MRKKKEGKRNSGRRRTASRVAISRKMNAINKAGRPIIPSRSSDESFSSGRARKRVVRGGRRGMRESGNAKKSGRWVARSGSL